MESGDWTSSKWLQEIPHPFWVWPVGGQVRAPTPLQGTPSSMPYKEVQQTHWFPGVHFSSLVPWFVLETLGEGTHVAYISPGKKF